jgi:hypothetical protein
MRTSLSAVSIALLLSACGTTPAPTQPPAQASATTVIPMAGPVPQVLVITPVQVPAATSTGTLNHETPNQPDVVTALLTYSERLRQLNANDLAAEIAVQGEPGNAPLRQMQLALALMQIPQAVDTARALGLVQRVVASASPEATPLKPFARLLVHRLLEQRKLEDNLERQAQQLRENQRRIDQLSERLEAMRAIERSLTTRPPAAPNGTRPTPP